MGITRRDFLAGTCAAAGMAAMTPGARPAGGFAGTLCLFSKHLPELDWKDLAKSAKQIGFAGIDLTVRSGGHVAPEKAHEDLPKAVRAIPEEGLEVPMITTELLSATPLAKNLLSAAGKVGIPFFKAGYYRYKFADVRRELREAGDHER